MPNRTIDPVLEFDPRLSGEGGRETGVRRNVLAFVVMFVVGVSGIATAGVLTVGGSPSPTPPSSDKAEANEQDDGVHGGPIERFHRAGSCDLTPVSSLPGNWTHGDYV